jgi:hypothetical protein
MTSPTALRRLATSSALTVLAVVGTSGIADAAGSHPSAAVRQERRSMTALTRTLVTLATLATDDAWAADATTAWQARIGADLTHARALATAAARLSQHTVTSRLKTLTGEVGLVHGAAALVDDSESTILQLEDDIDPAGAAASDPSDDGSDGITITDGDGDGIDDTADPAALQAAADTLGSDVLAVIAAQTPAAMRAAVTVLQSADDAGTSLLS